MGYKIINSGNVEVYKKIILYIETSKERDFVEYVKAFLYLEDFVMKYISLNPNPLWHEWGKINSLKKILKHIDDSSNEDYKESKNYLLGEFADKISAVFNELKKIYMIKIKQIEKKQKHQKTIISFELNEKIHAFYGECNYGLPYNNILLTLYSIYLYQYYIDVINAKLDEIKLTRQQMAIGIVLSIIGTVATFVFGIIPLLSAK